ncbi:hypothetical protein B4135_2478 [Caldibacillus debilis]|uniref:Uncharacterized protein n=1 Tax=Caldibacillus debilis TaxID=301148 RepID=A0A150LZA3_9BACI|nr:hypothetical protein B4135_2478 [Caldibacillus debilis]
MIRRTVSLFRTGAGQRAGEIDPAPAERGGSNPNARPVPENK